MVRTIKYRADDAGLIQAVTKVAAYFLMYSVDVYSTKVSYARFEGGVYHFRLERLLLPGGRESVPLGAELDLSAYVGRADVQPLVDELVALRQKVIVLRRWKGHDDLVVERLSESSWRVVEHQKEKGTGEIKEIETVVDHDDVLDMWSIVCDCCRPGESATYRQVVRRVIEGIKVMQPDADVELDSFNGGKYRRLYYFPLYYYPLKILEHLRFIAYCGSGRVTRISEEKTKELI